MTDALHTELLQLALQAARRAGDLLRDGRPADLAVAATKSSPVDVVTEMDLAAEKAITDLIADRRPDDGFLGEEGSSFEGTSGIRWVIDPLDGTVNYLYGLPTWAVSIAAEQDGQAVVGVVAAPMRGETFHAVRGRGAWATGAWAGERKLSCRPTAPLDQALVATGFSYVAEVRTEQAEVARRLLPLVRDIRRGGSAAIELCDVAAGRLDGYYERGLNPWDYTAGSGRLDGYYERGLNPWDYTAGDLIAREAGALTGGHPGRPVSPELTLAATPGVFEPLQRLLADFGA